MVVEALMISHLKNYDYRSSTLVLQISAADARPNHEVDEEPQVCTPARVYVPMSLEISAPDVHWSVRC